MVSGVGSSVATSSLIGSSDQFPRAIVYSIARVTYIHLLTVQKLSTHFKATSLSDNPGGGALCHVARCTFPYVP